MNIVETFNSGSNVIQIYSNTTHTMYEFLAFVTEFSDSRSCMWASQDVYGRMDSIYTYKNTTRKISISFDVPVFSETQKLNLANIMKEQINKTFYPIYSKRIENANAATKGEAKRVEKEISSDYSLATPPYHRIRFANFIKSQLDFDIIPQEYYTVEGVKNKNEDIRTINSAKTTKTIKSGLLGWIDGYVFSPVLESGFLQIPSTDGSTTLAAKLYKVKFTLNVIHEHPLGFRRDGTKRMTNPDLSFNESAYIRVPDPVPAVENAATEANQAGVEQAVTTTAGGVQ